MPANHYSPACQYALLHGCGVTSCHTKMAAKQIIKWKHGFKQGRVLRRKLGSDTVEQKVLCAPFFVFSVFHLSAFLHLSDT